MSAAPLLHRSMLAVAAAGLAGLTFVAPGVAHAGSDSRTTIVETRGKDRTTTVITHDDRDDWDDGWDDYNQTLIRMQRESIASQEEQAREAARARRRDEIEKNQQQSAAERGAYFGAILEDSQAALRAPRDAYFRKPGYSTADPPGAGAGAVEAGGAEYLYDRGVFWLHQGSAYIVVTAPVGAVVDALPRGAARIPSKPEPVWYFFGTFFRERGGTYEVIKPPAGLTVFYLPDGYSQQTVKGIGLYRFGETRFKPVFVQGVLAYQVVEP